MLKRLVVVSMSVAVLALAGNVGAVPFVTIIDGPGDSHTITGLADAFPTSGGEFGVDLGANGTIDFWTFCLERNETIAFDTPYTFTIDDFAIAGGLGNGLPNPLDPDPLDIRTANLFYLFATGNLVGYLGNVEHANALQDAIWFIEDELPDVTLSSLAQHYFDLSSQSVAGSGSVNVMNITSLDGTKRRQSVLHVPEPGTLLLLGSGLLGLGLLRRRRDS